MAALLFTMAILFGATFPYSLLPLPIAAWLLWLAGRWFRERWRVAEGDRGRQLAVASLAALALASPYLVFKAAELRFVLNRVPAPLHVRWIAYRLEDDFGSVGLPGDNETGFLVYRLTRGSAAWARAQGGRLGDALTGDYGDWRSTPVDDHGENSPWHLSAEEALAPRAANRCDGSARETVRGRGHAPSIGEYLARHGYCIPLDPRAAAETDSAINRPGSFYAYGRGGSVVIVDPRAGSVYFAYAG